MDLRVYVVLFPQAFSIYLRRDINNKSLMDLVVYFFKPSINIQETPRTTQIFPRPPRPSHSIPNLSGASHSIPEPPGASQGTPELHRASQSFPRPPRASQSRPEHPQARQPDHILQKAATVPIKPIKPIHVMQNAATVQKKPKKPIPQESWSWGSEPGAFPPRLLRDWFFWFFSYSCSVLHYMDWFYWFYWYSCSVLQHR